MPHFRHEKVILRIINTSSRQIAIQGRGASEPNFSVRKSLFQPAPSPGLQEALEPGKSKTREAQESPEAAQEPGEAQKKALP
jgi:hypothetical protein